MINEMLKAINPNLNFIEAKWQRGTGQLPEPIFFYHIPKTGGLSFFNSLLIASDTFHAIMRQKFGGHYVVPINMRFEIDSDITPAMNQPVSILGGHVPYGFHQKFFNTTFHLATFIRDPYERVLSEYTYTCMRSQQLPNLNNFEEFYQNAEKINIMCRQLHPKAQENKNIINAKDCIENLEKNFHLFSTVEGINESIQIYLNHFRLPNIMMERFNKSMPKYKLDGSNFREHILDLNSQDLELFEYVQKNPRLPHQKVENPENVELTIVIYETEQEKRSVQASCLCTKNDVINFTKNPPNGVVSVNQFAEYIT